MTFFRKKEARVPDYEHPAYKVGLQFGYWLIRQEDRLVNWLNNSQFRFGRGWRNAILLTILFGFAAYFIWLLT